MGDQSIEISEIQKNRFYFTNREITMLAVFIALLFVVDVVWVAPFLAIFIYGIFYGMVLIIAARVMGKKGTILIIGIVTTVINLAFAHMYGGTLVAFAYLTGAISLEGVLRLSKPYGENRNMAVAGALAYGIVSRSTAIATMVFVYGMILPSWLTIGAIVLFAITFPIGGLLGYKIGKKVKNVVESV